MSEDEVVVEVHLRVGPYVDGRIDVYFEPTGMGYELLKDDWLDVRIAGRSLGLIEIGHTPNAIVVSAWPGAELTVCGSDGTTLQC